MDWSRIPPKMCREIAVALDGESELSLWSGADAAAWLQQDFAVPDDAFMKAGPQGRTVAHIVRDGLGALGALPSTFTRAESLGLLKVRKGPAPSHTYGAVTVPRAGGASA